MDELKKITDDLLDNVIGAMLGEPIAIKNLAKQIGRAPLVIRDAIYWRKFHQFVSELKRVEEEFGEAIRLSTALFESAEKRQENGVRLLEYIDRADTEKKIVYLVTATRSFLLNLIDKVECFRIMRALTETLTEDLEFFAEIANSKELFEGNLQILALSQNGLMLQARIDANRGIENQDFIVSSFGRLVYQYALLGDDEARISHIENEKETKLSVLLPTISKDDIDKMFESK